MHVLTMAWLWLCLPLYTKIICRHPQGIYREAPERWVMGLAPKVQEARTSRRPGHPAEKCQVSKLRLKTDSVLGPWKNWNPPGEDVQNALRQGLASYDQRIAGVVKTGTRTGKTQCIELISRSPMSSEKLFQYRVITSRVVRKIHGSGGNLPQDQVNLNLWHR